LQLFPIIRSQCRTYKILILNTVLYSVPRVSFSVYRMENSVSGVDKHAWKLSTSGSGMVAVSCLCSTITKLLVTRTQGIPSLPEQLSIVEEYSLPWS